jgi:hypothetical protein
MSSASFPSVTFRDDSALTTIHEFDKVEGFDRPRVWWTPVDYTRFQSAIYRVVEEATRRNSILSQEEQQPDERQAQGEGANSCLCLRGIETYASKERRRKRRDRIQNTIWLVLDEQESNYEEGINDGFSFADKYQQYTASTLVQARARGIQDELEAQKRNILANKSADQLSKNKRLKAASSTREKWRTMSVLGRSTIARS